MGVTLNGRLAEFASAKLAAARVVEAERRRRSPGLTNHHPLHRATIKEGEIGGPATGQRGRGGGGGGRRASASGAPWRREERLRKLRQGEGVPLEAVGEEEAGLVGVGGREARER